MKRRLGQRPLALRTFRTEKEPVKETEEDWPLDGESTETAVREARGVKERVVEHH